MNSRQKQISNVLSKKITKEGLLKSQYILNNQKNISGTLMTDSLDPDFDSFKAPIGAKAVRFICRPRASLLTMCVCTVRANGGEQTKTGKSSIFSNCTIEIPLKLTDCPVEISFKVMDANGGLARWEVIY